MNMAAKSAKKSKKKWITLGIIVVIVVAAFLFINGQMQGMRANATAGANMTEAAITGDIEVTTEGNGTVAPKNKYSVEMVYDSKILEIFKENGDVVEAGDAILSVESSGIDDYIASLEAEIADDDSQISSTDSSGSSYISSTVTGRVKRIYAESKDVVTEKMKSQGALMEIAADGKLKVEFSTDAEVTVGETVTVEFSGYSVEGTVEQVADHQVTVTISDSYYYHVDEAAVVYDEDDNTLGTGALASNQPYLVSGSYGTINHVSVGLNEKVYEGSTLFTLDDVSYYSDYTDLIESRNDAVSKLQEAKSFKETLTIKAPYSGIISGLEVVEGTAVLTDTELCKILSSEIYQLKVEIDELDIDGVMAGQDATIVFDAFEDEEYHGTVTKVSGLGTNTSGVTTYTVVIELEGQDNIKTNMSADAKIVIGSSTDTILVPVDAIQTVNGKKYVEVVSPTNADTDASESQEKEMVEVTIGLVNNTHAEILSGISEGTIVTVISKTTDDTSSFMFGGGGGEMSSIRQGSSDGAEVVTPAENSSN